MGHTLKLYCNPSLPPALLCSRLGWGWDCGPWGRVSWGQIGLNPPPRAGPRPWGLVSEGQAEAGLGWGRAVVLGGGSSWCPWGESLSCLP